MYHVLYSLQHMVGLRSEVAFPRAMIALQEHWRSYCELFWNGVCSLPKTPLMKCIDFTARTILILFLVSTFVARMVLFNAMVGHGVARLIKVDVLRIIEKVCLWYEEHLFGQWWSKAIQQRCAKLCNAACVVRPFADQHQHYLVRPYQLSSIYELVYQSCY